MVICIVPVYISQGLQYRKNNLAV